MDLKQEAREIVEWVARHANLTPEGPLMETVEKRLLAVQNAAIQDERRSLVHELENRTWKTDGIPYVQMVLSIVEQALHRVSWNPDAQRLGDAAKRLLGEVQQGGTPETALSKMRLALPHIRLLYEMARLESPKGAEIHLRFSSLNPDGSGRVFGSWNAHEFLQDLAELVGVKDRPGWMHESVMDPDLRESLLEMEQDEPEPDLLDEEEEDPQAASRPPGAPKVLFTQEFADGLFEGLLEAPAEHLSADQIRRIQKFVDRKPDLADKFDFLKRISTEWPVSPFVRTLCDVGTYYELPSNPPEAH